MMARCTFTTGQGGGTAVRTFVRAVAFLVVFGVGAFFFVEGAYLVAHQTASLARHENEARSAVSVKPSYEAEAPSVLDEIERGPPALADAGFGKSIGRFDGLGQGGRGSFGTGAEAEIAHRIVYVVDRSGGMTDSIDYVKCELKRSIGELSEDIEFHVVFYSSGAPVEMPTRRLVVASQRNKQLAFEFIDSIISQGETDPSKALERAFDCTPDTIYLLTDGEFDRAIIDLVKRLNTGAKVTVHTVGFLYRTGEDVLKKIAEQNGGTYRFVSEVDLVTQRTAKTIGPKGLTAAEAAELRDLRLRAGESPLGGLASSATTAEDIEAAMGGLTTIALGLALMVSGTVLIAVHPRLRQAPPRPQQATSAKPLAAPSPLRKATTVTLDLGPREAPQSVTATFRTRATRRDGSYLRQVVEAHWRLIEPGWTEGQVRHLLGGPRRIEPKRLPTGFVTTVWHYGKWPQKYRGRVEFLEGKVVGFAAPPPDAGCWIADTPKNL